MVGLITLGLVALYSVVNAFILAFLLQRYFKLERWRSFFITGLIKTLLSQGIILASQYLFFMYYSRVQQLICFLLRTQNISCPLLDRTTLMIQYAWPVLVTFTLFAALIQFFFLRDVYHDEDDYLLGIVLLSNLVAGFVRYMIVHMVMQ